MAMHKTDNCRARMRPMRSPMCPKIAAPTGRMRKPAANAPNAAISETVGSWEGKNWSAMM